MMMANVSSSYSCCYNSSCATLSPSTNRSATLFFANTNMKKINYYSSNVVVVSNKHPSDLHVMSSMRPLFKDLERSVRRRDEEIWTEDEMESILFGRLVRSWSESYAVWTIFWRGCVLSQWFLICHDGTYLDEKVVQQRLERKWCGCEVKSAPKRIIGFD
ncbi:hypothetical protein Tco_1324325 [Tanacetum coccineum]